MNRPQKLTSQQKTQEQLQAVRRQQSGSVREFSSVEEMLRHDALHTPVPPAIAHRLRESIGPMPLPARPWWRRLLGQ